MGAFFFPPTDKSRFTVREGTQHSSKKKKKHRNVGPQEFMLLKRLLLTNITLSHLQYLRHRTVFWTHSGKFSCSWFYCQNENGRDRTKVNKLKLRCSKTTPQTHVKIYKATKSVVSFKLYTSVLNTKIFLESQLCTKDKRVWHKHQRPV